VCESWTHSEGQLFAASGADNCCCLLFGALWAMEILQQLVSCGWVVGAVVCWLLAQVCVAAAFTTGAAAVVAAGQGSRQTDRSVVGDCGV
jgi:hypothetical protein